MGVALHVVGLASHAGSLSMWLLYRMASATKISLESVVIPTKPHQPLSFNFQEVIWEEKDSGKEFSAKLVCKMAFLHYDDAVVFCHTCLMGFKLKRMKTSMRADPAFVSSIVASILILYG